MLCWYIVLCMSVFYMVLLHAAGHHIRPSVSTVEAHLFGKCRHDDWSSPTVHIYCSIVPSSNFT